MVKFTTRVELLNSPSAEDYETLHKEMEDRNFTRTIVGSDGIEYQLPPAEYNREGNYTLEQTHTAAINAAAATGKSYRVFVTESNGRSWNNLEEV